MRRGARYWEPESTATWTGKMMESSKWLSALEEFVTRQEAEGKAGKEE